jgi:hypothetical protein
MAILAGCGGPKGPPRYELSGNVTFRGEPVPRGLILLVPDITKGNEGPAAHALIVQGKYKTPVGQGVMGGPYVATIEGYEAGRMQGAGRKRKPLAKQLFSGVKMSIDLPHQDSTHDFVIPAE